MLFVLIFLIETKVDIETSECLKLFEWKPESKALFQQTILSEVIKLTQLPGPREFSCQAPTLSLYKLSLLYLSEGGLLPKQRMHLKPAQSTVRHVKPLYSSKGRRSYVVVIVVTPEVIESKKTLLKVMFRMSGQPLYYIS